MRMKRRAWGEAGGLPVWLFDFEVRGLRASVSNYGGILQALRRTDDPEADLVLGYDTLAEYQRSDTFFGAMIGPIADRMALGRCELDGRTIRLPLNAGPDSMHCADLGFHRVVWDWRFLEDGLSLSHRFGPSPEGFPGVLTVELRYRIPAPGTLRLEYAAECTRETALSLTNHSYFNLRGASDGCRGDVLAVRASRYAETERMSDPICTGRALSVDGTPLDLRGGATVGDVVGRTDFREIAAAGGVDHYFLVDGEGMREHAALRCPESGLELLCRSDAPGLVVYTGNGLEAEPGKGGRLYGRNWGVCFETEQFPNAVNLPGRRAGVLLGPGTRYRSATEFVFHAGDAAARPDPRREIP